jgi:hypothetical protein
MFKKSFILTLVLLFSVNAPAALVVKIVTPKAAEYAAVRIKTIYGELQIVFKTENGEQICEVGEGTIKYLAATPYQLMKDFSSDQAWEVNCISNGGDYYAQSFERIL